MKNIIFYTFLFSFINFLSAQELFLQGEDKLKGSVKVDGQEYITVYDNDNFIYRYFDKSGNEIFLIKSYNEKSEQIALSIEKNQNSQLLEIIIENIAVGFLVNSIIYDFDNNKIGQLFRGKYSQNNIKNFWKGFDTRYGNISIYDHTSVYKIGSLTFKQPTDYYAIINFKRPNNVESLDAREARKVVRNLQKHYRKLIRSYKVDDLDIKNNQDDKEVYEEFLEVTDAYEQIMKEFGVDESDEKIFGIIPQDYFSEQRRSKWSQDEGYVPFTKRELNGYEEHRPDLKIQKDELYHKDQNKN